MKKTASRASKGRLVLLMGLLWNSASQGYADIFNTASIAYGDALGRSFAAISNSVVVVTDLKLPPLNLGGFEGKSFFLNQEIVLNYTFSGAATYSWSLEPLANSASVSRSALALGAPAASVSTNSPRFDLSKQLLEPGPYRLTVVVTAGSQVQSASANIALVSANLSNVKVYPNPWRVDRHLNHDIVFANLTPSSTIKIFTVSGHLVRELVSSPAGTASWDRKTDGGEAAASGIYLYVVTDLGQRSVRGKIVMVN